MIREEIILKPGRAGTMKQIIAGLDHMALPNGKITCIFKLNKQDLLFTALDCPACGSAQATGRRHCALAGRWEKGMSRVPGTRKIGLRKRFPGNRLKERFP